MKPIAHFIPVAFVGAGVVFAVSVQDSSPFAWHPNPRSLTHVPSQEPVSAGRIVVFTPVPDDRPRSDALSRQTPMRDDSPDSPSEGQEQLSSSTTRRWRTGYAMDAELQIGFMPLTDTVITVTNDDDDDDDAVAANVHVEWYDETGTLVDRSPSIAPETVSIPVNEQRMFSAGSSANFPSAFPNQKREFAGTNFDQPHGGYAVIISNRGGLKIQAFLDQATPGLLSPTPIDVFDDSDDN